MVDDLTMTCDKILRVRVAEASLTRVVLVPLFFFFFHLVRTGRLLRYILENLPLFLHLLKLLKRRSFGLGNQRRLFLHKVLFLLVEQSWRLLLKLSW